MLQHRSSPEPVFGPLRAPFFITFRGMDRMTSECFAIVNAGLLDGSGAPLRHADVAVEAGRIRAVAPAGELDLAAVPKIDARE